MSRLPRFERSTSAPSLVLTDRDLSILRHVAKHRFLTSRQIAQHIGGSVQHVLRRLQRLFHHGYLDRPRVQLRYFSEAGSQPIAYAVTAVGAQLIADGSSKATRPDNQNVKQLYLQHSLLVAEIVTAFEAASRTTRDVSFDDSSEEIIAAQIWSATIQWGSERKRTAVRPDAVFALTAPLSNECSTFFLEADRGTMPLKRHSLSQSSVWRKMLGYLATWQAGNVRQRFGCPRFRVLIVTPGKQRADNLTKLCRELPQGRGLFLITDAASLLTSPNVLMHQWQTPNGQGDSVWRSESRDTGARF